METKLAASELKEIRVDQIDRNPENPRIVFRPGELETLMESIRRYGVQVPISVFKEGRRYVLIDGERRWRCSVKLNRPLIPALIQDKPTALTNLLLMFNIHALREQWDLLTIALKLPRLIALLTKNGRPPTERELSAETGLARGLLRRCRLLMELPPKYREDLLDELNRPKSQQKLTEDFFIEMERALTTVQRALPDVMEEKDRVRDVLISKYKVGTIKNITDFRSLAKIARAEKVSVDEQTASSVIRRVFQKNDYSLEQAYRDSVSEAYSERDLVTRIEGLLERLDDLNPESLDDAVLDALRALLKRLSAILRRR
jgi:ParB family transcriptional regulator, chromosome partitioning protein